MTMNKSAPSSPSGGWTRAMTLASAVLLLQSSNHLQVAMAQQAYACPNTPGAGSSVPITHSSISVPKYGSSANGGICTLSRVTNSHALAPVARSYDGNEWELSAGPYAGQGAAIDIQCSGSNCVMDLPPLDNSDAVYVLTSFEPYLDLSDDDDKKAALVRFLEQTTYGANQELISQFDLNQPLDASIEQWVKDQVDPDVSGLTSHREYYRRRMNPRLEASYFATSNGPLPCEKHSRWRKFAFSVKDSEKVVTFASLNNNGAAPYTMSIGGNVRTIVDSMPQLITPDDEDAVPQNAVLGTGYEICWTDDTFYEQAIGSRILMKVASNPSADCLSLVGGNPQVDIGQSEDVADYIVGLPNPHASNPNLVSIDDDDYESVYWTTAHKPNDEFLLTKNINRGICSSLPNPHTVSQYETSSTKPIFGKVQTADGASFEYLLYDPRLQLRENTLENPLPDGGGSLMLETSNTVLCSNVPRTFMNEDHCFLSEAPTACSINAPPTFSVQLSHDFLTRVYQETGRYVYAVDNLPITEEQYFDTNTQSMEYYMTKPCETWGGHISRWLRVDNQECSGANYRTVGELTEQTFATLLEPGFEDPSDLNFDPDVKDVELNALVCDDDDVDKFSLGVIKGLDGTTCWRHVHPQHMNVYDLTDWADNHSAGGADKIHKWAEQGLSVLRFPDSHHPVGNFRFINNIVNRPDVRPLLGKYNQYTAYADLPSNLKTPSLEAEFGSIQSNPAGKGVLVCGSLGEVASDPTLGSGYDYANYIVVNNDEVHYSTTPWGVFWRQKASLFATVALTATDQLRQRVAFALSQILVISPTEINDSAMSETTLDYYDIFVRNAFGNYRDVLKQVAFHDRMGEMLSSLYSKSVQRSLEAEQPAFPDENFAREIMQLFSIGLVELNQDGTPKLDSDGNPIPTYDNSDILSFARAWTGFSAQEARANFEYRWSGLDPMNIWIPWRDYYPKSSLDGGYIGDSVPLCTDMPKRHHLREGAVYRLLGGNEQPEMHRYVPWWQNVADIVRLNLDTSSPLYDELCADDGSGCTFPGKVVLPDSLLPSYSAGNSFAEFGVDTVMTVQVRGGGNPIFYEYVRQPCVEQAYYDNAKRIVDYTEGDHVNRRNMCADPRQTVAAEACCEVGWDQVNFSDQWNDIWGTTDCKYQGERMSYSSAEARCAALSTDSVTYEQCDYMRIFPQIGGGACSREPWTQVDWWPAFFRWTTGGCDLKVKVKADGEIAIVHDPVADFSGTKNVPSRVSEDTINFFKAAWTNNGEFPTPADGCSAAACVLTDGACICNTNLVESTVFASASDIGSRANALSMLKVGAFNPSYFDDGTYTGPRSCSGSAGGVKIYTKSGNNCNNLGMDAIFEIVNDYGVTVYLKNMESVVGIDGTNFAFRNPVHFISIHDPHTRDAYHETEAVLDHYFYHPSHAPFLAVRMLQRFGFSNPSPRFVTAVVDAYKSGTYEGIGSGKYGDLGAMVAAIVLDREARSISVASDPGHGQLREPLLKVFAFLRGLEYHHDSPLAWPFLAGLQDDIGQGSHQAPSVFSFFLSEFVPAGTMATASLASPESLVLTSAKITDILDSFFQTSKFGNMPCDGGLSDYWPSNRWWEICPAWNAEFGDVSKSYGYLTLGSSSNAAMDIVNELAIIMTAGRLHSDHKSKIASYIQPHIDDGDKDKAVRYAQQLISTTAEFQTTSIVQPTNTLREVEGDNDTPSNQYRAVVYLMLEGGMDSHNLLVPVSGCANGKDLYKEYQDVRSDHALRMNEMNLINANKAGQTCSQFGINKAIPILDELYGANQAMFFANHGVLQKKVTKENWSETKTPLFSHNSQQRECFRVDIENETGETGVGGRLVDVLKRNGYKTATGAVGTTSLLLSGSPEENNFVTELPWHMPSEFNRRPEDESMAEHIAAINDENEVQSGLFGDHWSTKLIQAMASNIKIHEYYTTTELDTNFGNTGLDRNFESVARWIKSRGDRKVDREVFYIRHGGYDLHAVGFNNNLEAQLGQVNAALSSFVDEMKAQGIWESIAIVSGTDFGRTLTLNSGGGTDHGWGGIGFMMGGGLDGGKVHGQYPDDLTDDGEWSIGRGRQIPTLPLEASWQAVAQWMGATDPCDLDYVLPNRDNFDTCNDLFVDEELFTSGNVAKSQCSQVCQSQVTMTTTTTATTTTATTTVPDTTTPTTTVPPTTTTTTATTTVPPTTTTVPPTTTTTTTVPETTTTTTTTTVATTTAAPATIQIAVRIQFDANPQQTRLRIYDRATKKNYYRKNKYPTKLANKTRTYRRDVPADQCTKVFLRDIGGLSGTKKITVTVDGSQKFSGNLVSNRKNKKTINVGQC